MSASRAQAPESKASPGVREISRANRTRAAQLTEVLADGLERGGDERAKSITGFLVNPADAQ